jgi:hypothetical protein
MRALEARSLTKEGLKLAANYQVGDAIVYSRANNHGIRKGDMTSVLSVGRDSNVITVMRESDGKTFEYNPRRTGTGASVYQPRMLELQAGGLGCSDASTLSYYVRFGLWEAAQSIGDLAIGWVRRSDGGQRVRKRGKTIRL